MTDYACKNVIKTTIRNIFLKAGFLEYVTFSEIEEVNCIQQETEKGELNSEQWKSITNRATLRFHSKDS